MAQISTLVEDIENLLAGVLNGTSVEVSEEDLKSFGEAVASKVKDALTAKTRKRTTADKTLYMSELGKPCNRQLWYELHPEAVTYKEKMQPHSIIKFLYGDILEEVLLLLAKLAGHKVEQRQAGVELQPGPPFDWKARGRIDAIIDDHLVDVKSASAYSFRKFVEGLNDDNDAFGYRGQLDGYVGTIGHIIDGAGFFVVNKETGKLHYAPHEATGAGARSLKRLHEKAYLLDKADAPPRAYKLQEDNSGNLKLGVNCSYCPFKYDCWHDANDGDGLRTFIYSTGPVFLGTVNKAPRVPEITQQIKDLRKAA